MVVKVDDEMKGLRLYNGGVNALLDSGCSRHMFMSKAFFNLSPNYRPYRTPITVGDGKIIWSQGVGDIFVSAPGRNSHSSLPLHLAKCLYVPELKSNLISVSQLDKNGATVLFQETEGETGCKGRHTAGRY